MPPGELRRVHLQSRPVLLETGRPHLQDVLSAGADSHPLDFSHSGKRAAGCLADAAVEDFFHSLRGSPDPVVLPPLRARGTRTQRLHAAPPLDHLPPYGVPDGVHERARVEMTRTQADLDRLGGAHIGRDALRKTPACRATHVLRPGYVDRGTANTMRAAAAAAREEQLHAAARLARAEVTRRRMRCISEGARRQARALPVPVAADKAAQVASQRRAQDAWRFELSEGVADVADSIGEFERLRQLSRAGRGRRARVRATC